MSFDKILRQVRHAFFPEPVLPDLVDAPRLRVEKTDYGWQLDYADYDEHRRYQPVDPGVMQELEERAEKKYREQYGESETTSA